MKPDGPVYVTRPMLPPLDEFYESLKEIWKTRWITNMGPFHEELESKLCDFLNVKYISLFSNGTLALITALQALEITGEVITTPYSFVATSHALWWNGINPVFSDIEPGSFNINPDAIEPAITHETTAIMPVHVYGTPCNINAIKRIADKYNLRIIYDAAHAFGVKTGDTSILEHGDLSILSFHATKVFNTIEGGAIVCHNSEMKKKIDFLKNFGFADEVTVVSPGINAKMNEVQAAFGLLQLKYVDEQIARRKKIALKYRELLGDVKGISLQNEFDDVSYNYAYFPILVQDTYCMTRDGLYALLAANQIFARRYFYPLISQFPPYRDLPSAHPENIPVATNIANRIICLPIYADLETTDIEYIAGLIRHK